ncbi:MAG: hypothetical protein IJ309_00185 [Clostridia bacterium]|nr:hypothetical protein [Clostridia bacterium]
MKKTYRRFKLFLPIIAGLVVFTTLIGIFMFAFNYLDSNPHGIHFSNVSPILFFVFLAITIGFSIYFVLSNKHIYITRTKNDSGFFKFSSLFAILAVITLSCYDLWALLQYGQGLDMARIFKVLRLIASIPAIVYLVLNALPKRINRQNVVIPELPKKICSIAAILWSAFGLLAIFTYSNPQQFVFFKVMVIIYYILLTLYFLFDAKNSFISPNAKLNIVSAIILFIVSFAFTVSALFGIIIGKIDMISDIGRLHVGISEFELVCALALGLYGFAKACEYATTLKYVIETESVSQYKQHKKPIKKQAGVDEQTCESNNSDENK